MVRSLWIAAVGVALAWTGLAGAQPFSAPGAAPRERYITVREEGKPPQRCKLLKTWREGNGVTAFQVQAVDTGELMTMVESGPVPGQQRTRAMATRIFRWGRDNKPPAGSPVPPPTATMRSAPLGQAGPPTTAPVVIRQPAPAPAPLRPIVPARVVTPAQPTPTPTPVLTQVPHPAPVATVSAPIFPEPFTSTSPTPPAKPVTPGTNRVVKSTLITPTTTTPSATPGTPSITHVPARKPEMCDCTPPGPTPQPRLVPSASGTVCQTPCDCCCQSTCVSCTPPLRQSWISRIFKSNPAPTAIAAQNAAKPAPASPPPTAVAKVATEPAQPSDWRQSWGKVEPWKNTTPASAAKTVDPPAKPVARMPVQMDAPRQPDPLKDPDWYRSMALKEKPANSKVPDTAVSPVPPQETKSPLMTSIPAPMPSVPATPPAHPVTGAPAMMPSMPATAGPPAPGKPRGPGIELSANEGNAFWMPSSPPKPSAQPAPKYNAFQRDENSPPPQGGVPGMAGAPQGPMPMQGPPQGPMPMMAPRPSMPLSMVDSGVPSGMGNAFTVAGTRRPLPPDFGPTPQEPNGFGDAVPYIPNPAMPPRSPMLPPSPGMLGALQLPMPPTPPMSNAVAMSSRPMNAINPLMAVPPTPVASTAPAAPAEPANVPQMLTTLKDSLYPSQREWAAEQLSQSNGRGEPQVVQTLTKCAKEDPAATVRAACVHALAHMKANTTEVTAVVQELKNDRDPRVRQEADEALNTLGIAAAHHDSAVQPASHK